jgi:hypothetical protein
MIEILCSGLEGQTYSIDNPQKLAPLDGIKPPSPPKLEAVLALDDNDKSFRLDIHIPKNDTDNN